MNRATDQPVRTQRLAVVVEDRDHLLAIHLCDGWRETLAVIRAQDTVDAGAIWVRVVLAEDVLCRWKRGGPPLLAQPRYGYAHRRAA